MLLNDFKRANFRKYMFFITTVVDVSNKRQH